VVEMYFSCGSIQEIAEHFGASKSTINLVLTERNIPRTNRGRKGKPRPIKNGDSLPTAA
jgi:hypothetical protein